MVNTVDLLDKLAPNTWTGTGFNLIAVPTRGAGPTDPLFRLLLSATQETLGFSKVTTAPVATFVMFDWHVRAHLRGNCARPKPALGVNIGGTETFSRQRSRAPSRSAAPMVAALMRTVITENELGLEVFVPSGQLSTVGCSTANVRPCA